MKTALIILAILACIAIVGELEGDAFTLCKEQTNVSYETCLKAHNIK